MSTVTAALSTDAFWLAIAAVVAACALVFSVIDNAKAARQRELRAWQAVVLQRIVQPFTASQPISFDAMLQAYRVEATTNPAASKNKNNLSGDELRRILIDLVSNRVVQQAGNDRYFLEKVPDLFESMAGEMSGVLNMVQSDMQGGPNAELMKLMLGQQKAAHLIYAAVAADPFKFTAAELAVNISSASGIPPESIRALIVAAISKKELAVDKHQHVGVGEAPLITAGN